MTYHYGNYWAEILPIHSSRDDARVRYWQYRIYQTAGSVYLFDGHDSDLNSARKTVEAHIDCLISEDSRKPIAA